jgi:hypothetical protein
MDINTGKLGSSSDIYLKKLRETEFGNKISSKENDHFAKDKLLNDFADVKFDERTFKSRIINNNKQLSEYENNMNEAQFFEQKLNLLSTLDKDLDKNQIIEVLDNSIYNNTNVMKDFFPELDNFYEGLAKAKEALKEQYNKLDKDFKQIEISSQNILSTNLNISHESNVDIGSLEKENILDVLTLNAKRVLELVS